MRASRRGFCCVLSVNVFYCRRFVKRDWSKLLGKLYGEATLLRSKDLERKGLSRTRIREAVELGVLERISRGLYARPDSEPTEHHSLVQVARLVPGAAICLLSALRFHELTTQNPHEVWIAIDPKARKPVLTYPTIKVQRFGADQFKLGLESHRVEGINLRVYSVARTVVDLFRYRNKIGLEVALEALKEGWQSRRFTLVEINRIANRCRMEQVMKPYIESLTA